MTRINPEILVWARNSAGFTLEQATQSLGWHTVDKLYRLEIGELEPTRPQLIQLAEKYRRPLLSFYLPRPPKPSDRGQDFRTIQDRNSDAEALLQALIRDVQTRQELVKAALEEAEEDQVLKFVGSAQIENGIESVVSSIRNAIDFGIDEFRKQKTASDAFSKLRSAVERAGVFVLLVGNLGSHHSNIEVNVFRGFALSDPIAPFVVINENDSRSAWAFTLIHELAHVWLGQTGVSGYSTDSKIEKFCDRVAARFLLLPQEVDELVVATDASLEELISSINTFANSRRVSRKMIAYSLLEVGHIDRQKFAALSAEFDRARLREKEALKQLYSDKDGAPDYYTVRRHRLGPGLLSTVRRMVSSGVLTTTKAARILGVKPTAVFRTFDTSRAA